MVEDSFRFVARPAAIDDDVAWLGEASDCGDGLFGGVTRRQHDPIDRHSVELVPHILERVRADRASGGERRTRRPSRARAAGLCTMTLPAARRPG